MDFYVYEHWRPDTDVCFYVGKGRKRRAYKMDRSSHHMRVLKKLARLGLAAEVRIVAGGLTEPEAFELERERIEFWLLCGVELTNKTEGGEGTSGYQFTAEQRAKLSVAMAGKIASEATRAKMRARRAGRVWSEETKEKMRQSALRVQGESRRRYCQTEAGREQMRAMAQKDAQDSTGRSERAKALWQKPEYRERVLAARAARRGEP